jgi:hypothetical protein
MRLLDARRPRQTDDAPASFFIGGLCGSENNRATFLSPRDQARLRGELHRNRVVPGQLSGSLASRLRDWCTALRQFVILPSVKELRGRPTSSTRTACSSPYYSSPTPPDGFLDGCESPFCPSTFEYGDNNRRTTRVPPQLQISHERAHLRRGRIGAPPPAPDPARAPCRRSTQPGAVRPWRHRPRHHDRTEGPVGDRDDAKSNEETSSNEATPVVSRTMLRLMPGGARTAVVQNQFIPVRPVGAGCCLRVHPWRVQPVCRDLLRTLVGHM